MVTPKEERQETFPKENWVSSKLKKKGFGLGDLKKPFPDLYVYVCISPSGEVYRSRDWQLGIPGKAC